jgi:hypothetical protein
MATLEEQIGETRQAFKELADGGREWVELEEEVARRIMMNRRRQHRERRSRAANTIADLFSARGTGATGRIPWHYRHKTQMAAGELEAAGEIEHRFVDEEGRLRKKPEGRLDYRDRRYRLVPEAAEGAETSPLDRFEGLARRIEALPGAGPIKRSSGEEAAVAARDVDVRRLGLGGPTDPEQPSVKFYVSVGYLPDGGKDPLHVASSDPDKGSDKEPAVISAASYTPGHEGTYNSVSADRLAGASPSAEDIDSLSALEGAVSIIELSAQTDRAEGGMVDTYRRFFSPLDSGPA